MPTSKKPTEPPTYSGFGSDGSTALQFGLFDPPPSEKSPQTKSVGTPLPEEDGDPSITWKELLGEEREKEYFKELQEHVKSQRIAGKTIYPPHNEVFNAFKLCALENLKVVILGQDPYHGPNQAHGLCFSVRPPTPPPPSLVNIYKELNTDLGAAIPNHGNLERWAEQGVLLLNTILTVERGKPASHRNLGWERFTDTVIERISSCKRNIVFLLWGAHAQGKRQLIDRGRHHVFTAPHPSPFSANRGFFGCKHFSKANSILRENGRDEIDWQL